MTDMRAVFVFLTYSWQESKSFPKIYGYSFNSWDADSSWCSVPVFHTHSKVPFVPLSSPFNLSSIFPLCWYCFHFSACQGFPPACLWLFHSPPQGSLLSQLTDICQWRNITTIADVEMLIPSSLNSRTTTPGLQHIPAGSLRTACSCFCPLKRPAVGPDREAPAVNDQSLLLIHADV